MESIPRAGRRHADPFVVALPGGGTVLLKALDIMRDPADTPTNPAR